MDNLQLGIDALKAGKRDEARNYLAAASKENPEDEFTWQWLYNACNTDKERYKCLQQILRINPQNEKAKTMLEKLTSVPVASPAPTPVQEPAVATPTKVNPTITPNTKNTIIGISAILLLCCICSVIFSFSFNGEKEVDYKQMALIQCHIFLSNRLKSPSTADFPTTSQTNIKDLGNRLFEIKSYVDAQNSFGAKIRTYYYCKVQYIGTDKSDASSSASWSLIQLDLLE